MTTPVNYYHSLCGRIFKESIDNVYGMKSNTSLPILRCFLIKLESLSTQTHVLALMIISKLMLESLPVVACRRVIMILLAGLTASNYMRAPVIEIILLGVVPVVPPVWLRSLSASRKKNCLALGHRILTPSVVPNCLPCVTYPKMCRIPMLTIPICISSKGHLSFVLVSIRRLFRTSR
ncbi:uncharacterized protein BDV17DRAFT_69425 [Aspergillus undulatus]|uniref:uncharacterized protein n=1 Tax=Aspergillus undulatus TaxID=1810928 RepID=UPI003CCCDAF2